MTIKGGKKIKLTKKASFPKKDYRTKNYFNLFGIIIILLLGVLIYSNSFKCSFQYDDYWIIVNNSKIHDLMDIRSWINFFPTRPVSVFTFALNYHFNHLQHEYYHLVNLVIHLFNACLVWWLTWLIFSSPACKEDKLARDKKIIAFLVALLFVSHPLAIQVVTYITQRMASLATMFYLLSLALYMYARINRKGNIAKIILFVASFLSALLAVFSKETAYTLPFVLILCEIFLIRTPKIAINYKSYRLYLVIAGLLALFTLVYLKFSFSIFNPILPALGRSYTITPMNYLFTEFSVIVKYMQLLLVPLNQNMDYDFPISESFFEIRTLLSFLFLLFVFTAGILLYKKNRIISFGIFWFFITLSVESSVIPLNDFIDEYRTYLPSFGFLLAMCYALFLFLREKFKFLLFALLAIIIASNSIMTYNMNKIWKDDLSLWNDVVSKSPGKARPYNNRGFAYDSRGQIDNAIADYSKAIEITPDYVDAFLSRGIAYGKLGQWNKAINDLSKVIATQPYNANAYSHRGIALANSKKWNKALDDFSKVIDIDSTGGLAFFNRGFAYSNLESWEQAIADYSKAISKAYTDKRVYTYRGMAYQGLSHFEKAIADYNTALLIDPAYEMAISQRDMAYKLLQQQK